MEQQQAVEIENGNEKEEIVSNSPDSGINLSYEDGSNSVQCDSHSGKSPNAGKRIQCSQPSVPNSLYPFYYKYPDNKKLTLLKSLSQDSEYSLDASLFDAEGFLQEMGFAGSCDPIIPDRFLPSLIQRLSQFPEAEIESLNDRIVQSIGCFRRKEGKRRLFRNLSIGKGPQSDQSDIGSLSCPNNYPLLRSNTGPATFSFEDSSFSNESTELSRYNKPISSGTSNNSSFAEDDLFPTSPIAILVSSASIDAEQEEKIAEELPLSDEKSRDFEGTENFYAPSVDVKDINITEHDSASVTVDKKIQEESLLENVFPSKRTNAFSVDVKAVAFNDNTFTEIFDNEKYSEKCVQLPENEIVVTSLTKTDDLSIESLSSSSSFQPTFAVIDENVKPAIIKHPLRRLSEGSTFYSQNYSLIREPKIDFSGFSNNFGNNVFEPLGKPIHNNNTNREPIIIDSSIECSESPASISIKDDTTSFHDANDQDSPVPQSSEAPSSIESYSSTPLNTSTDSFKRNKPVYTRDDSLSNFLSSMLNTNDESLSPSSPTASQVFTFDTKSMNPESRNNQTFFENSSLYNDDSLKNVPEKPFVAIFLKHMSEGSVSLTYTEKDKLPNRKRRLLRRMSSSFNYDDEEIPSVVSEPIKIQSYTSSNSSPSFMQSRKHIHTPCPTSLGSSCPIIYPCCCLSPVNVSSFCDCQRDNVHGSCDNQCWSLSRDINSDNRHTRTQTHRKYKRSYKKGRYLSCPPSIDIYNCKTCFRHQNISKSTESLCTEMENYYRHHTTNLYSKSFINPQCSDCFVKHKAKTSSKEYLSDPQNSKSFRDVHRNCCNRPQPYVRPLRQDIAFFDKYKTPQWNKWSSSPDIRYEYSNMPNSYECINCDTKPKISNKLLNKYSSQMPKEIIPSEKFMSPKSGEFINFGLNTGKVFPKYSPKKTSPVKDFQDKSLHSVYNTQFLSSSKQELHHEIKRQNLSLTSQHLISDINYKRNMPLRACNSYPLQNDGNFEEDLKYNPQNRRSSYADERTLQYSPDSDSFQNNKREALMEKKIRVFSKFLTNLGNLSKSISNDKKHTNQNSTSELKCHDFAPPDKTKSVYLYNNQDKHLKSDKCQTSSPEFGKLLKVLNSMDLNKSSTDIEFSKNDSNVTNCVNPTYENSVSLELNDSSPGPQQSFTPVSYTSSVSLFINNGDSSDSKYRLDKKCQHQSLQVESRNLLKDTSNLRRYSLQMPFKEVSRDLEELQLSIQKAKEMRISASKELHLLQELLSKDSREGHEQANEKNFSIFQRKHQNETTAEEDKCDKREALADLRKNSVGGSEEEAFWQGEMKKMKEENDAAWQMKLDLLEKKLASQEEELQMVQNANEELQKQLELQTSISQSCQCRTDVFQNGVGRTDSAFEDDEDYVNHKSSIPIHSMRQECERLQEQLLEAEQKADQLNLLLNQKLIEFNKLQLTLSKQTKEMVELEKSYLQLQHRVRKGTSKPMVAKLCSRTSPFNSKNLFPKPSPPATPNP